MSASKVNKGVRKGTVFGGPRALPEDRGADAGRRPLADGRGIDRRRSRFAEPASQRGIGPRRRRIGQGHLVLGLLALLPMVVAVGAAAGRSATGTYTIVDLGTLGGATSVALGINDLGQVCGSADIASGYRHAFLWEDGVMTDLGTIPGILQSEAWGINNAGAIVGLSSNTGANAAGFIWENGEMKRLLETPTPITGFAINDHRQVVGVYRAPAPIGQDHAFLWKDGVLTDLGTLGGSYSIAWDINDAAQIAGMSFTETNQRAFLWEEGVMSDLGTLAGGHSEALGINAVGQIVGMSTRIGGGGNTAVLWEDGGIVDLGALIDGGAEGANAINNSGQILLWSYLYQTGTGGGAYLDDLLPPGSGWSGVSGRDLNDAGQIVGDGWINGQLHAFLMTPIPPPQIPTVSGWSLVLMTLGLLTAATIVIQRSRGH